ncbi:hypothetical protein [Streptomyces sp. NPDC001292]|uniref:hypothetical protein n=1 Tax=Streptomyces sp. NPDC001292 TaxID=3364558 RepID=UPI0036947777
MDVPGGERALLLLEVDGTLYVRCGQDGDDTWLVENVARRPWRRSASTWRAAASASPCSLPSRSPSFG